MGISVRIYPLVISCSGETQCFFFKVFFFKGFPWFFRVFPCNIRPTKRPTDAAGVRQGPGDCRAQLGCLPRSVDAGGTGHTTEDGVLHAADDGILSTTHGWLGHLDGSYIWNSFESLWSYLILPYLVLSIISTISIISNISTPSSLIHPIPSNPSTYLSIHLSLFQCPTHMYDYVYI